MTYREMAVKTVELAGQELIDRAEGLIPNATNVKNIDIWIHIPSLSSDTFDVPEEDRMNTFVMDCTLEDLRKIENFVPEKPFNAFVIVPTGDLHESGWGCMKFIFLRDREIIGAASGWSDVINLNGIGGYGLNYEESMRTQKVDRVSWSIDILPNSGCVRVFSDSHYLEYDHLICSSFQIYTKEKIHGKS